MTPELDFADDEQRLSPSGLPWPGSWSLPRADGRFRNTVAALGGTACLLMAVTILTDPRDDHPLGWMCLMLVVISVLAPVWMRLGRRRDAVSLGPVRDGSPHQGIAFPTRRSTGPAMAGTIAAMGAASILLAGSSDPSSGGDPLLYLIGALCLGVSPAPLMLKYPGEGAVLTPQAVIIHRNRKVAVVPWDAVTAILPLDRGDGLLVIDLLPQNSSGCASLFSFSWPKGYILVGQQKNDPALLLHAIVFYARNPDKRHELAEPAAVERVTAGDLRVPQDAWDAQLYGRW